MNGQAPAEAYPLQWPAGWDRTAVVDRRSSQFGDKRYGHRRADPLAWARDHLVDQVRMLGGSGLVLSTNVEVRRDGLPYANRRQPDDPGVAAYWLDRGDEWRVVACDRWLTVWENLRAVGLTLEALRGLERWGASGVLTRAFAGFKALPGGEDRLAVTIGWRDVLGVSNDTTLRVAEVAYRTLALRYHPDRPEGSPEMMAIINTAIAQARTELG